MAPAGQAFVFDEGRLGRLGLSRLDEVPVFASTFWPLAGWGLPAVARWEKPGCDFARGGEGSIGRFHILCDVLPFRNNTAPMSGNFKPEFAAERMGAEPIDERGGHGLVPVQVAETQANTGTRPSPPL